MFFIYLEQVYELGSCKCNQRNYWSLSGCPFRDLSFFSDKKQTEESRLAATRELSAQTQTLMEVLLANPELIARYGKDVQMYEDLPNEERLWAAMLFQRMFRAMEQQLMHSNNSHKEKVYFEAVEKTILEMLSLPGVQQW
ncbi:MAG: hypothetical protein P8M72_01340 [Gammaproteobacteria bacterium]|nr:hypothetical protein [Gammaproteobacteria bacterium]